MDNREGINVNQEKENVGGLGELTGSRSGYLASISRDS